MNELKEVSWTEIQGNRFSRGLHQLMLKDKRYPITQKSRVIGAGKFGLIFSYHISCPQYQL